MTTWSKLMERLRGLTADGSFGLRAPYPPVALQIDGAEASIVRLRRRGRGRPTLEAHAVRRLAEPCVPASILQPAGPMPVELGARLRDLFEQSGTKPGRVSLVLPDNLAKISLLALPERPASPRRLDDLVRFKIRRAVPFRLEDASLAYQLLPGAERGVAVLVVLTRRTVVERLEQAIGALGARVGLVDISTPNLLNLYRTRLDEATGGEGDAGLLNCAGNYFSLAIVRGNRLIFFRCKTFGAPGEEAPGPNGTLARELAGSLSYYRDKLSGSGIRRLYVRSTSAPFAELAGVLASVGVDTAEPLDPGSAIELPPGSGVEGELGQRLAPALGAAVGRSR